MNTEEFIAECEKWAAAFGNSHAELPLPTSEGWWWEWVDGEWDMRHIVNGLETCNPGRWVKAIPPTERGQG
jgi:hypothetical protein